MSDELDFVPIDSSKQQHDLGDAVVQHLARRTAAEGATVQQVFMRAFPASIQQTGPRTLTGRLVPYDTIADVLDEISPGKYDQYREGFRRAAFENQVEYAKTNKGVLTKIGLIHRHEGGLGYLGPFVGLRDEPDGLYGDVMVLPGKAEDVGALLSAGVDELSVEFRLRPGESTVVDDDGVRWRTRAHLDQVALEPKGAYSSAQVLAYRAEQDELSKEQAEANAAAKANEEREAADAVARENQAAADIERRRQWDALMARLPSAQKEQEQLVRDYGIMQPGGYDLHRR